MAKVQNKYAAITKISLYYNKVYGRWYRAAKSGPMIAINKIFYFTIVLKPRLRGCFGFGFGFSFLLTARWIIYYCSIINRHAWVILRKVSFIFCFLLLPILFIHYYYGLPDKAGKYFFVTIFFFFSFFISIAILSLLFSI